MIRHIFYTLYLFSFLSIFEWGYKLTNAIHRNFYDRPDQILILESISVVSVFLSILFFILFLAKQSYLNRLLFIFSFLTVSIIKDYVLRSYVSEYLWRLTLLLSLFFSFDKKNEFFENNFFTAIKRITLLTYFISGLWKVIALINSKDFFHHLKYTFLEHIADTIMDGHGPPEILKTFITTYSNIITSLFWICVFIQLAYFLCIFTDKYNKSLALFAITFHVLSGLFLGIWFVKTIIFIQIIFFFDEFKRIYS